MEQVLQLLRDYGPLIYGLLFAYCALKSGTLPLFAGFAAGKGALDPLLVVIFVFAGAVLGDEARFAAARRWGVSFLPSFPKVDVMMKRGISMAARYGEAYLFLYRYPKGMRTVGAFPIGLTDMHWLRFSLLNILSAGIWTGLLVGTGYWLGDTASAWVTTWWGVLSVGFLIAFSGIVWWLWRKSNFKQQEQSIS